ncbi:MAG: acyl-CoA dehydrogenase family protein [SAR324 cluster bacterium]|nr:acyl-CoA dehydrogenase family protein [SAR324 cluster bacterium]
MPDRSFLNWPFFAESHRTLAEELEVWCAKKLQPSHPHTVAEVDAASRALVRQLAQAGWLRWCVPKASGGNAETLDVRSLCLTREALARHWGLADFAFAMQGLGSGAITLFGTDPQKASYLPEVRRGEKIAAFALTEPEAGSDVANLATTAVREGNHFVLNGSKTWISNGGIADFYTVFARTGEAPGAKGLTAFIVDADAEGLEIAERQEVIAPHPLATLRFRNCKVPASAQLGALGQGFKIAMGTLDIFRSTVGAAGLGFARRALDEALGRVTSRKLFGQTMDQLPLVQAKLGEMALQVDASALLVYRAAWTRDTREGRVTREASMAKLHATESAQQVIDAAVQLFGGLGVKSGMPVEELYREIRALRIYEGASEVQQLILGDQTLRAYRASG